MSDDAAVHSQTKVLRDESMRISSQHERLNELYADLRRELYRGAAHSAYRCFGRLRDALEAHFEVEDGVYFPAVRGLLPERDALLNRLQEDHRRFRAEMRCIDKLMAAGERDESSRILAVLVGGLVRHEQEEEVLLGEILGEGRQP